MQQHVKPKSYEALLIGEEIRYARLLKRFSQAKLARTIGVSPGWIGRVERGKQLPNILLLIKIAKALGIKVKQLIPF